MRFHPTADTDPLVRAVDRLWQDQKRLLPRWTELLRTEPRTPYEEGELRLIEAKVAALRALSRRFCTILRDEAWARYHAWRGARALDGAGDDGESALCAPTGGAVGEPPLPLMPLEREI